MDMSYKKMKRITKVTIYQIILKEHYGYKQYMAEKYLKWIYELLSDDGHMHPILTHEKVIHHTLPY